MRIKPLTEIHTSEEICDLFRDVPGAKPYLRLVQALEQDVRDRTIWVYESHNRLSISLDDTVSALAVVVTFLDDGHYGVMGRLSRPLAELELEGTMHYEVFSDDDALDAIKKLLDAAAAEKNAGF